MILNLIRNQDTEGSILSVAKENMSQRKISLLASLLRDEGLSYISSMMVKHIPLEDNYLKDDNGH